MGLPTQNTHYLQMTDKEKLKKDKQGFFAKIFGGVSKKDKEKDERKKMAMKYAAKNSRTMN
jgi:uncharacterized protein YaaN involved in tellurite resistance